MSPGQQRGTGLLKPVAPAVATYASETQCWSETLSQLGGTGVPPGGVLGLRPRHNALVAEESRETNIYRCSVL